mmetsp:Transcript_7860/g.18714  ORF Transcript_7860/g.18714 Transcript_7860/m.18714 type:complete len:89 (+) Transcript_7860:31-297(+)
MMKLFLAALLSCASAFQMGVAPMVRAPMARAAAPQAMFVPDMPMVASLPTTSVLADSTLLLASGGLTGFLFLFVVVGTIVVNFGIIRK